MCRERLSHLQFPDESGEIYVVLRDGATQTEVTARPRGVPPPPPHPHLYVQQQAELVVRPL